MKRKTLFFLLGLLFLVPLSLRAYDFKSGDLCYNITSNTEPYTVEVTQQSTSNDSGLTTATIPETVRYNGITYTVTRIGDKAFYYCTNLTSITIPNTVTSIGDRAFYACKGLTSITIPNTVTSIGDNAFYYVVNIVYYGTATGSPWGAFVVNGYVEGYIVYESAAKTQLLGCSTAATGEIVIPESVTSIGDKAFSACSGLTSITIPNTVTSLGDQAFYACKGLTSITIPNTVTSIGDQAFFDCSGLTSITIPESVTSIGNSAFSECSGLTSITIPESVTSIGNYAFSACSGLTSITIPESVTSIGEYAFRSCTGLAYVNIPENVTTIEPSVFHLCCGLTSITIPDGVTSIGDHAFGGCSGLLAITIGDGVKTIGKQAFSSCSSVRCIVVGEKVTTIGDKAFRDCKNHKVFCRNQNLNLEFNSSNGGLCEKAILKYYVVNSDYGCNHIDLAIEGEYIFMNAEGWNADDKWWKEKYMVDYLGNATEVVLPDYKEEPYGLWATFLNRYDLTKVTFPESVTWIGNHTFYNCSGLTSITIPNSVMSIEEYTFSGCTGLTSISIPNSVMSIEEYTFSGCTGLTSISIPESVTEIANDAFYGCTGLTSVVWNAKQYANFSSAAVSPFYDSREQITSFSLGNGVEHVPAYLCYGMDKLTSVTIPNSVTNIGESAFDGCSKLSELHLGASLETIGANTFAGCLRLGNIYSYVALPPLAEESSFVNYNARLYVPCEVLSDYQLAIVFGNFKYIDCISSNGVDVPNNTVTVTPSTNDATFTWPSNNNANAYTLEITKDGVVFCTLTFNANGQLMGIAFAPSKDRNNAHAPQAAQATTNGWQFTVTGLNEGSNYAYTLTVTDSRGQKLQTYNGTFRTLGTTALDNVSARDAVPVRKILRNGQVFILRGNEVYTVLGEKVK